MNAIVHRLPKEQNLQKLFRYWVLDPLFGGLGFMLHYLLRLVPLRLNSLIGAQLGKLVFHTYLSKKAARTKRNLALLKPELNEREIDAVANKMWENIGQTFAEYSVLDKLWRKKRVRVDDAAAVGYLLSGKPVIFTAVHLGNWEAQASYIHEKNIPLMAMYKPVRNRFSLKLSKIARSRMNILTIPTDSHAMRKMYRHLENNGAVWLPIDDLKRCNVNFPRFGRSLHTKGTNASHIVRMAKRFDAAIIPVQIIRNDESSPSFDVKLHQPMFLEDKTDDGVNTLLQSLDKMMESWILERPEQWFMMHELRL